MKDDEDFELRKKYEGDKHCKSREHLGKKKSHRHECLTQFQV